MFCYTQKPPCNTKCYREVSGYGLPCLITPLELVLKIKYNFNDFLVKVVTGSYNIMKIHCEKSQNENFLVLIRSCFLLAKTQYSVDLSGHLMVKWTRWDLQMVWQLGGRRSHNQRGCSPQILMIKFTAKKFDVINY